jgi:hypothetical protein
MVGLVAIAGSMYLHRAKRRIAEVQEGEATASTPVEVTHVPVSFVPPLAMHRLKAVIDGAADESVPGLGALFEFFAGKEGSEFLATGNAVPLESAEALAAPERFRGGLVTAVGRMVATRTLAIDHPGAPEGIYYWTAVAESPRNPDAGFIIASLGVPAEFEREDIVTVNGVFLQTVRYEGKDGTWHNLPLVVAPTFSVGRGQRPEEGWLAKLFLPMVTVVVAGIGITTFILMKQIRQRRTGSYLKVRPPGPRS